MNTMANEELNRLISWYVNGTLPEADRNRVEELLRTSPQAQQRLTWERSIRDAVRNDPNLNCAPDLGLAKVMQRIRAEAPAAVVPKAPVKTPGLYERFSNWLAGFNMTPGMAMACGVVVIQFGVMLHIWPGNSVSPEYAQERSMAPTLAAHNQAFVRITFAPDTREADLRRLVRSVNAELVAGPSQIGEYYLMVAKQDAQSILVSLKADKHIDSVEIANELPTRQ